MDINEYFLIVLYCLLALCGFFGNIWVMFIVFCQLFTNNNNINDRNKNNKFTRNHQYLTYLYILILSIVDFISILSLPLIIIDILYNQWPFNIYLCKFLFFCEGTNKTLSPLILTLLSIDRYIIICLPNNYYRQNEYFLLFLLTFVVISLFFIIPIIYKAEITVMFDNYFKEHTKCVLQISKFYDFLHISICYILPLLVIVIVYLNILKKLYKHIKSSTIGNKSNISLNRVIKSSVMIVLFYFICWTPYWILRIFAVFFGSFISFSNNI